MEIKKIVIDYFTSPIGLLELKADNHFLYGIRLVDSKEYPAGCNAILTKTKQELDEYFSKKRTQFTIPMYVEGTLFQTNVWAALQEIPYGMTLSYQDVALKIHHPKSSRAVGNANNKNPILILIPCHRVIGSSGRLVGYAGGLDKKKWLLAYEQNH
ncbi:MAG: methylated-DNA--[protein]-cysteine S-methyltransferase [Brevinema sp.]